MFIKIVKRFIVKATFYSVFTIQSGPGGSVGIVTGYGLDGPGIETR
jgi:hypothetical protein